MAQERKKRRIVLASILKPVDDTRLFEKMGVSLAHAGYDVFIIGFPSSRKPEHPGIHCIPLPLFQRISIGRLLAKWRVLTKVIRLRPSVVIISTHELLLPCVFLKAFTSVKIVYDVRENYYRNILHSGSFHSFLKWPVALLVRFKEIITSPLIDHFLLAEREYDHEFSFHRSRWTIVENKALPLSKATERGAVKNKKQLLFSGTVAESTGVYSAISLCQELNRLDNTAALTIIGYAALEEDRRKCKEAEQKYSFIKLIGIDSLVPHDVIGEQIQKADFGILSYPAASHTNNSRPTKLFEYLCAGLPIILEPHWPWIAGYESCKPFVFVDFSAPDVPKLVKDLSSGPFYISLPKDVTWASEAPKLLNVLESI